MTFWLQGVLLGLAYVAPIGVQNLFVINAGLTQSWPAAYRAALVTIFFDVTLALAGFFGMGILLLKYTWLGHVVLGVGSLLVITIGIRLLLSRRVPNPALRVDIPFRRIVGMACTVTWLNPQALIDVSALLGSFRAALAPENVNMFMGGVICASFIWFLGLVSIALFFKHSFTPTILRIINLVCGFVILLYGIKLGWAFIQMLRA